MASVEAILELITTFLFIKLGLWAGETAQQLSALAVLAEERGSVSSIYIRWLTVYCNSSSRGSHASSLVSEGTSICMYVVHPTHIN